jgi:quercetin dioxygenase-like cupin family protein
MTTATTTKEIIRIGQVSVQFLLEGKDTNGQVAMFEFSVPAGAKVPVPHYHEKYEEIIYGLAGVLTFTVDEKLTDVGPGGTCFIRRGAVHGFNNPGQQEARALAVITPGILGPGFFKEISEVMNAAGPPDIEKARLIYQKHGLVPVIPKR